MRFPVMLWPWATEIRPQPDIDPKQMPVERCENTDEVVGTGDLHVEQMSDNCFWARLYTKSGKDVVMWFNSNTPITLTAELD